MVATHRRSLRIGAAVIAVNVSLVTGCNSVFSAQPDSPIRAELESIATKDSTIRAATRALENGRPWEATRLLAPVLRDSSRRSSAALLRAAEAASAWEGWKEVVALLESEPWLAKEYGGHGF